VWIFIFSGCLGVMRWVYQFNVQDQEAVVNSRCWHVAWHVAIHRYMIVLPVLPVLPHGLAMELLISRGHVSYVLLPPRARLPIYRLVRYLCRRCMRRCAPQTVHP